MDAYTLTDEHGVPTLYGTLDQMLEAASALPEDANVKILPFHDAHISDSGTIPRV
jgi:hypothetical protein